MLPLRWCEDELVKCDPEGSYSQDKPKSVANPVSNDREIHKSLAVSVKDSTIKKTVEAIHIQGSLTIEPCW
jgi:hypothetical protein